MPVRPEGGLSARSDVELRQDVLDVALGRTRGDAQFARDVAVAEPARQTCRHLSLASGEDRAGVEEATQRAASWVKENVASLMPNPPQVTMGEVVFGKAG